MLVFSQIYGRSSHALYSLERRKGYMNEMCKDKAYITGLEDGSKSQMS